MSCVMCHVSGVSDRRLEDLGVEERILLQWVLKK